MARLGISIYPEHASLEENIGYIQKAAKCGFTRIFSCLLSLKDKSDEEIKSMFLALSKEAHTCGMEIFVDVSPAVFAKLHISYEDLSFFESIQVDGIRLDEGFGGLKEAQMTHNPQKLIIELNASLHNGMIANVVSHQPDKSCLLYTSIPIGIRQAVKKFSKFDNFWTVFSLLGVSVPTFFFALLLVFYIAIPTGALPVSGMRDASMALIGYDNIFQEIADVAVHMILPVTVLAFSNFATFSRYVRSAMIDVINQDYVRTARAKGLKEKVVIYRHAFKNAMIPLVTLLGLYIPSLFSGAMILESVFAWPGLGKILVDAITNQDQAIMQACLLFSAILMVLGNLLSDVLYSVVDPRVKVE